MAIITLSEVKKLGLDDLQAGLAESIITVNPIYNILPWNTVNGNAYVFNREGTEPTIIAGGRGQSTTSAKGAPTFTQVTQALNSIVGDAEISPLDVAQGIGSNIGNDAVALQVAAKAKAIGREYQRQMVLGDSAAPGANVSGVTNAAEFDGLIKMVGSDAAFASQKLDKLDAALTMEMLDELIHAVTATNASFLMCNSAALRKIRTLMRASGGTELREVAGVQVDSYNGVPIFRNDWITSDVDGGTAGLQTHIFAGAFDDGSRTLGMSGVLSTSNGFLDVVDVGPAENADIHIYRAKMYSTFAVHSVKSVAALWSVTV